MKKYVILTCLLAVLSVVARAQTFVPTLHKVPVLIKGGTGTGDAPVTIPGGSPNIKRTVIATDFPTDWLKDADFGFCDDGLCESNVGDTFLWNKSKASGTTLAFTYGTSGGMLELVLSNMAGKTTGCFYVSVQFKDVAVGGTVDTVTYNVCYNPLDVTAPAAHGTGAMIYPNPANDAPRLYCGADMTKMTITDLAGRTLKSMAVTSRDMELDIADIRPGMYFATLYGKDGNVAEALKFTKR